MGKTRGVHETTPELRNRMVGMYEAGLGLREIAAAVNCSPRTVKRWLNRFDKEGTVETRERCGRKRATTAEQDEAIIRLATQKPITAAKAVLPALGLTCSVDTIRERLHKAGIHNWSPSRKYMQNIPLGDADGTAVQQPVWRPTGTQLGKKKSSKKNPPRKIRARDVYVGDGAPVENQSQTGLTNDAVINQQTRLSSYHQHSALNVSQSWPLDLVQGAHHFSQNQPDSISHEQVQASTSNQLQELHGQEQEQQHQQHHVQQVHQTVMSQTHNLEQQHGHLKVEVQQQHLNSQLTTPQASINLTSDNSNARGAQDNNQFPSVKSDRNCDTPKEGDVKNEVQEKKKKGGKAKGTLETSVEIRNRMIGMSEAGLSTLSIALAIDRSERTVKRWLERWHKEGNVQTKERKGRRRSTTKEQDEAIIALATQQPLTAAKHVAPALGLKCSVDTIRERLHKAGIHSWKLGKKHGEGNVVHTVHLWQPSGTRPNKPKLPGEKRKRSSINRKREQASNSAQQRLITKKKKTESASAKNTLPSANMRPEQTPAVSFHNSGTNSNIIQPVCSNPTVPVDLIQSHSSNSHSETPQSIQQIGSMMQQRPDCRLASATATPVSPQGNDDVTYPSCMVVTTNTNAGSIEQSDSLNFEPYIWTF